MKINGTFNGTFVGRRSRLFHIHKKRLSKALEAYQRIH